MHHISVGRLCTSQEHDFPKAVYSSYWRFDADLGWAESSDLIDAINSNSRKEYEVWIDVDKDPEWTEFMQVVEQHKATKIQ